MTLDLHEAVDELNNILDIAEVEMSVVLPESQLSPQDKRYYQEELLKSIVDKQETLPNDHEVQQQLEDLKVRVEEADF